MSHTASSTTATSAGTMSPMSEHGSHAVLRGYSSAPSGLAADAPDSKSLTDPATDDVDGSNHTHSRWKADTAAVSAVHEMFRAATSQWDPALLRKDREDRTDASSTRSSPYMATSPVRASPLPSGGSFRELGFDSPPLTATSLTVDRERGRRLAAEDHVTALRSALAEERAHRGALAEKLATLSDSIVREQATSAGLRARLRGLEQNETSQRGARDELSSEVERLTQTLDRMRSNRAEEIGSLQTALAAERQARQEVEAALYEVSSRLSTEVEARASSDKEAAGLRAVLTAERKAKTDEVNRWSARVAEAEAAANRLREETRKYQAVAGAETERTAAAGARIAELEQALAQEKSGHSAQVASLSGLLADAEARASQHSSQAKQLQHALAEAQESHKDLLARLAAETSRGESATLELAKLKSHVQATNERADHTATALAEASHQLDAARLELSELRPALQRARSELAAAHDAHSALESRLAHTQSSLRTVEAEASQVEGLRARLVAAESRVDELNTALSTCRSAAAAAQQDHEASAAVAAQQVLAATEAVGRAQAQVEHKVTELQELQRRNESLQAELQQAKLRASTEHASLAAEKEASKRLETALATARKASSELTDLRDQLLRAGLSTADAGVLWAALASMKAASEELPVCRSKIRQLEGKLLSSEQHIADLQQQLDAAARNLSDAQQAHQALASDLDVSQSRRHQLEIQVSELAEQRDRALSKCSAFDDMQTLLESQTGDVALLKQLRSQFEELTATHARTVADLNRTTQALADLQTTAQAASEQLDQTRHAHATLEDEYAQVLAQATSLKAECELQLTQIAAITTQRDQAILLRDSYHSECTKLQAECAEKNRIIDSLSSGLRTTEQSLRQVQAEFESTCAELARVQAAMSVATEDSARLQRLHTAADSELRALQAAHQALEQEHAALNSNFAKVLSDNEHLQSESSTAKAIAARITESEALLRSSQAQLQQEHAKLSAQYEEQKTQLQAAQVDAQRAALQADERQAAAQQMIQELALARDEFQLEAHTLESKLTQAIVSQAAAERAAADRAAQVEGLFSLLDTLADVTKHPAAAGDAHLSASQLSGSGSAQSSSSTPGASVLQTLTNVQRALTDAERRLRNELRAAKIKDNGRLEHVLLTYRRATLDVKDAAVAVSSLAATLATVQAHETAQRSKVRLLEHRCSHMANLLTSQADCAPVESGGGRAQQLLDVERSLSSQLQDQLHQLTDELAAAKVKLQAAEQRAETAESNIGQLSTALDMTSRDTSAAKSLLVTELGRYQELLEGLRSSSRQELSKIHETVTSLCSQYCTSLGSPLAEPSSTLFAEGASGADLGTVEAVPEAIATVEYEQVQLREAGHTVRRGLRRLAMYLASMRNASDTNQAQVTATQAQLTAAVAALDQERRVSSSLRVELGLLKQETALLSEQTAQLASEAGRLGMHSAGTAAVLRADLQHRDSKVIKLEKQLADARATIRGLRK